MSGEDVTRWALVIAALMLAARCVRRDLWHRTDETDRDERPNARRAGIGADTPPARRDP